MVNSTRMSLFLLIAAALLPGCRQTGARCDVGCDPLGPSATIYPASVPGAAPSDTTTPQVVPPVDPGVTPPKQPPMSEPMQDEFLPPVKGPMNPPPSAASAFPRSDRQS